MGLLTRSALVVVLCVGAATVVLAAGGGGSAGGSGAQNAINSGRTMADGQPGPLGSPNNPRRLKSERPGSPSGIDPDTKR